MSDRGPADHALTLGSLLEGIEGAALPPEAASLVIRSLGCRPQEVQPGGLYAAFDEFHIYNLWQRGQKLMPEVWPRQPAAVLVDREWDEPSPVPVVRVPDPRRAFAAVARAFYGKPDERLRVVGITGTNGKTTTARLLAFLLQDLAGSAGSLGTLGVHLDGERIEETEYTTALAHDTFRRLARFADLGAKAASMEVSSHALALDRVAHLRFAAGVFTNLTRDHLDFHGSMEDYLDAKARLFTGLDPDALAVVNNDSAVQGRLLRSCPARIFRFGSEAGADYCSADILATAAGTQFTLTTPSGASHRVRSRLIGRFQVENILAALTTIDLLGYPLEQAVAYLHGFTPVAGRMERLHLPNGATALVDYAHNPGGLENLLRNARELNPRRLLIVFGCGGDRDRGKRPQMGRLAELWADAVWVTSDNPRTEDPLGIIRDIVAGVERRERVRVHVDRATAIAEAVAATQEGDLLLVAGKGHEDYQIIGRTKLPYSDMSTLRHLGATAE